jgi:hypothetical protein
VKLLDLQKIEKKIKNKKEERLKMKKHKNRIVAGIILGILILVSVVPAMAEESSISLNPMQPTTAGSFAQISWSSTGVFEPNVTLELFKDGILNRTIVSETPLVLGSYYWAIPLSLGGLHQINITANTTTGQELTNTTDINITTPTEQGCRYCHTYTGTNNSGVYNNTLGGVDTRHHNLVQTNAINPLPNRPYGCGDCHPIVNGTGYIDHNCLDCHNGTAFWANPSIINAGAPHFSVVLSNYWPYPGDNILVIVNAISMNSVTANGVSLTKLSNQAIWDGIITAINGTHSVNVSASNSSTGVVVWDNSTSYTAATPNIIVTSPMTGAKWVRGTTQTISWNYVGNLGYYAKIDLLEQGTVDQTWNNVPQSNGIGSYNWSIPSQFKPSTYQIRVSAGGYSNTTGNFSIVKK